MMAIWRCVFSSVNYFRWSDFWFCWWSSTATFHYLELSSGYTLHRTLSAWPNFWWVVNLFYWQKLRCCSWGAFDVDWWSKL